MTVCDGNVVYLDKEALKRGTSNYVIDKEKCIGCTMCQRNCPADAISVTDYTAEGHKRPSLTIDTEKCIKCGACMSNCKFGAISKQ